jgi:hypothetical protein
MKFSLYDSASGGNQIGSTILQTSIPVKGGLFTTPPLDFGASIFTGSPRWLNIEISPGGANTFTPLSARQPLTATPYAVRAGDAGTLAGQSPSTFAPASGSSAYVAKAGDTMTGTLNLPANGLAVGGNQFVVSSGNVGIGTASPGRSLSIQARFDGDGISLIGSQSGTPKDAGYLLSDDAGNRAALGLASFANAWAQGAQPGDLILAANQGNVRVGVETAAGLGVPVMTVGSSSVAVSPNDQGSPGNIALTAGSIDGTAFYCHSYGQPFHAHNDFTGTDVQLAVGQAGNFTGDVFVSGRLQVAGDLAWGSSILSSDERGSIELGDSASLDTTPYIDFHHGEFGQGPEREHEDYNVRLINDDDRHLTLDGALDVTRDSGFDAHLQVGNGLGVSGDAAIHGNLAVEGVFVATVKLAVVPTSQGRRGLYCEESSQVWFADYGFGQLQGGEAVVQIDPLFAETVNLERPYHVFVQINDPDSEGVAVVRKSSTSFAVKELRKGKSHAEFSYRLVALRRGFEDKRLELMPDAAKANERAQ